MNRERRERLEEISGKLDELILELESLYDEEEEALENLPENLSESEQAEKMQEAVENLDTARCSAEEALDSVNYILNL